MLEVALSHLHNAWTDIRPASKVCFNLIEARKIVKSKNERMNLAHEAEMYPKLDAGGKPSTWFPPEKLVEHIIPMSLNIQSHISTHCKEKYGYYVIFKSNITCHIHICVYACTHM